MKLTPMQVERTLRQLKAQAIPDNHPMVSELNELFGEHTYFIDANGLSIVEPVEHLQESTSVPVVNSLQVVNIAKWGDDAHTSLAPHDPEPTDVVVALAAN